MSEVTLDANGVKSLQFDLNPGVEWINRNGSSWALDAEMRPPGVFNTYASPTTKTLVSASQIHYVYPLWDLVYNAVANSDGSVTISGVLTNNSTNPLVAQINLLKVNFPKGPYTLGTTTAAPFPYNVNCADSPGFVAFEVGATAGAEVWMWEDQIGVDGTITLASPNWGGYTLSITGDIGNATPPGGTFTFSFKLQCLSSDSAEGTEVQRLGSLFAIAHPQLTYWYDRRPIGQLIFSGGGTNTDISKGPNPRNWFNDQTGATTVANAGPKLVARGKAAADNVVAAGGQGFIIWDVEGAPWPQGLFTYGGDPRLNTASANPFGIQFAPEMDAVIDGIIQYALSLGLKVGFCLRMNTVQNYSQYPAHSYSPYVQDPFASSAAAIADLAARVTYCQNRWGSQCRLFYVDSAGQAPAGQGGSGLNNYGIWKALQQQFPNCFFAPEQNCVVDYAYASVYLENRGGSIGTSPFVRGIYPQAFTLLNLANYNASSRAAVLASVIAGDIPLFECWYGSPETSWMESILTDAKAAGWTGNTITAGQQVSLLTDIQNAQTSVAAAVTALAAVSTAGSAVSADASKVSADAAKIAADAQTLATDLTQLTTDLGTLSTAATSADLTSATNALAQARTDLGA